MSNAAPALPGRAAQPERVGAVAPTGERPRRCRRGRLDTTSAKWSSTEGPWKVPQSHVPGVRAPDGATADGRLRHSLDVEWPREGAVGEVEDAVADQEVDTVGREGAARVLERVEVDGRPGRGPARQAGQRPARSITPVVGPLVVGGRQSDEAEDRAQGRGVATREEVGDQLGVGQRRPSDGTVAGASRTEREPRAPPTRTSDGREPGGRTARRARWSGGPAARAGGRPDRERGRARRCRRRHRSAAA